LVCPTHKEVAISRGGVYNTGNLELTIWQRQYGR
jgi:hypothetical protein